MKKILCSVLVLIILLSTGNAVSAKSFSIDRVHIKSWIQPNGELLVNEVFTYTLDGTFSTLSRSFPEKHANQIDKFEAYQVKKKNAEPGFIEGSDLMKLSVTGKEGSFTTNIEATNTEYSVLYIYQMKDAVRSYKDYSELDITYFDDGTAHDQNYSNVTIDFILPESVNPTNFEGVLFDRNGKENVKAEFGIRFFTSLSQAYTETKTSFFFPSSVMTEQVKGKSEVSYGEAVRKAKDELSTMQNRLSLIERLPFMISKIIISLLVISVLFFFLPPQRHFWRKGSADAVILTDPLYLFFVDKAGKPHRKAFLAGLFSMVEQGAVQVRSEKAALRFKGDPKIAEETLSFRLKNGSITQQPFEMKMIQWLFSLKSGSSKWTFHLHDAAGAARKEKDPSSHQHFNQKVKRFKKGEREWYRLVVAELKEAGTLNDLIPTILITCASIIVTLFTSISYYADLRSNLGIIWTVFVGITFLLFFWLKRWRKRVIFFYTIIMFVTILTIVDEEVMTGLALLLLAFVLFYWSVPMYILSNSAVRAREAIRSFKREIRYGPPDSLSYEEREKWLTRAYLLSRKSKDIPLTSNTVKSPLQSALAVGADPLSVLTMSWLWTKGISSGGGGGSSSDAGGSSFGGSGGGDGGGAGAD
ncbi:DUF2207 domain-containing protein [Chungangia koreensis]|uniref:DUF2207 domain-containing protein n=1 Tax=Chungangia koreensis TaxID=752657 RepID=A0ABV8X3X2_9LACT